MLSSTTTSMPTVSCPPRWIAYPNMGAYGAHRVRALTEAECLDACADDPRCVAVAWTRSDGCWVHHEHRRRPHRNDKIMTEYEIVRQCNFKSSVLIRIRDVITSFYRFLSFRSTVVYSVADNLITSQSVFFSVTAYTLSQKPRPGPCPYLRQILTDFHNLSLTHVTADFR